MPIASIDYQGEPGLEFKIDAMSSDRSFHPMTSLQSEFVTLDRLPKQESADDILSIEVVQVKVRHTLKNEADDDMLYADEEALSVYIVGHLEYVNAYSRVPGAT